jgi:hypothetical protein
MSFVVLRLTNQEQIIINTFIFQEPPQLIFVEDLLCVSDNPHHYFLLFT